ncbi:MAG: hypothetical protein WC107_07345 [Patescibacteria group bacterium]
MIVIQMEGGCINGVFTDDPELVGKTVVVAHADTEECDELESLVKINGAEWHLVAFDVEGDRDTGPYFFPGIRKWVEETRIEGIELL